MAGARKIQANYEQLEQAASLFAQQSQQSQQLMQTVSRVVGSLQNGGWVGQGAQTFFSEMEELVFPALHRLVDGFEYSGQCTGRILQTLHQAEEEAARLFSGDGALATPRAGGDVTVRDEHTIKITGTQSPLAPTLFAKGVGDANDIDPNDVSQGGIGDCALMAGLAEIAAQHPELIRNAIHDNGNGTYTVTFYEAHRMGFVTTYLPQKITVDAKFPTGVIEQNGNQYAANLHASYGDSTGTQTEIWPTIMEKAYAEWKGSYADIESRNPGRVLTDLTGIPSTYHEPDHFSIEELAQMHNEGQLLELATPKQTFANSLSNFYKQNLVNDHAYYITGVDPKAGTVTLQNPWGWSNQGIVMPYSELGWFSELEVNPGK